MRRLGLGILLSIFLIGLSGCGSGSDFESKPFLEKKDIRILGGNESDVDAWPWMVGLINMSEADSFISISNYDRFYCGGSLIDSNWVVTAAHCVDEIENFSNLKILLGTNDLTEDIEPVSIKQFIVHPDYSPYTLDSDIALIELKEPVNFPHLNINLDDNISDKNATAIGWGAADYWFGYYNPKKLRQVTIPIVSQQECRETYGYTLTENMLCAGKSNGSKSVFFGDSGGPLVVCSDDLCELVGISSFISIRDQESLIPDSYGVFTRISKFQNWISANINNEKADLAPLNESSIFIIRDALNNKY